MKCKQFWEKIEKLRVFFEAFNKSDQKIRYATKEGRGRRCKAPEAREAPETSEDPKVLSNRNQAIRTQVDIYSAGPEGAPPDAPP